jgi:8-oxo-dGTP pyrophosphatase MutT (NUDIX family)
MPSTSDDSQEQEIRFASTVVLLRDAQAGLETLMLKRASKLVFFGGAWVFPGGKIEPEDGDLVNGLLDAARVAGARELFEEAGIQVDSADLVPFARWVTPPGRTRRFDTFYFVVSGPDAEVKLDLTESDEHRWLTPAAALEARARGEIELPPPTYVTVAQLAEFTNVKQACAALADRMLEYVPHPSQLEGGGIVYLYAGDAGYDTNDANAPGARHRLWAADGSWRYERHGL